MNSNSSDLSSIPEGNNSSGEISFAQPPASRVIIQLETRKPIVTYTLAGITVLFFILQMVSNYTLGFDLPAALGAKVNEYILRGQVWRLLTPILLHGSITHIFFNMYALISIGRDIELYYGHKRYLLLYLLAGFSGNVLSFLITASPSYGASTSIFGLIAAEGVFIYQNREFFRNPRAMLMNILVIVGINLFIVGMIPNIDNFGHLGGLIGGALFAWLAGPVWAPQEVNSNILIKDSRDKKRTLPVGLGVCLVFFLLAAIKFVI